LLSEVNWSAILLMALIATPATLLLNAVEFSLSARLIGQSIPLARSMSVTIVGSAANLLPLPGATLVRLAALKSEGATLRSGLYATALLAILSLGLGFAYSGLAASLIDGSWYAIAIFCSGLAVTIFAWMVAREVFDDPSVIIGLTFARVALIMLDAARTYLAFVAIGADANFGQASVLTISTVLAAVVAIVPSGLGLREGIAAFMAQFIGLQPAEAFLATSLSRLVGLSIVTALTVFLIFRSKAPSPQ